MNVVLDEARRICFLNFGEIERSHEAAVEFMSKHAEIPIPGEFPTVITSAAGHPLDATYYQTVKAMVGAAAALEPGGAIFVASACTEGLGSAEFREAQSRLVRLGPDAFLEDILAKKRQVTLLTNWPLLVRGPTRKESPSVGPR